MAEYLLQAVKLLEASVACFVSGPHNILGLSLLSTTASHLVRNINQGRLAPIGLISLNSLSWVLHEKPFEVCSEYREISKLSCPERAIGPDNVSCLDCNCQLISNSRTLELVGVPGGAEGLHLLDPEVRSID